MLVTKVVKGVPQEVKEKRILRIKEALSFKTGLDKPIRNVIAKVNNVEVYFDKPGKEYYRESSQNINDMAPGVGEYYLKYAFKDVWKDLLNFSINVSEEVSKKLFVIIYRLAFLMDCKNLDGKIRFMPDADIMKEIENIQEEVNKSGLDFKVLEFLHFLDVLGWNEDVKYQASLEFVKPRQGRINNLLSMISIPLIFKGFVDTVIDSKGDVKSIDFTKLIDMAQEFSRTRGIMPISNKELIEELSPFLE